VNSANRRERIAAVPRWNVRRAGSTHIVEIRQPSGWQGLAKTFRCDDVERRLRYGFGRRTRTIAFDIAGTPAALTYGYRYPRFFSHLARKILKLLRDPRMWLAYAFGGPGVGGGAVGASTSFNVQWFYELSVNGKSRGTWIVDGRSGTPRWVSIPAGMALPDPNEPE
jgi:hypothetical protein